MLFFLLKCFPHTFFSFLLHFSSKRHVFRLQKRSNISFLCMADPKKRCFPSSPTAFVFPPTSQAYFRQPCRVQTPTPQGSLSNFMGFPFQPCGVPADGVYIRKARPAPCWLLRQRWAVRAPRNETEAAPLAELTCAVADDDVDDDRFLAELGLELLLHSLDEALVVVLVDEVYGATAKAAAHDA